VRARGALVQASEGQVRVSVAARLRLELRQILLRALRVGRRQGEADDSVSKHEMEMEQRMCLTQHVCSVSRAAGARRVRVRAAHTCVQQQLRVTARHSTRAR
jgi:hypothetical protein